MEPFAEEHPELTGSLISMEFGPGGRVVQLWASDPALPEEGDAFQFILPPVAFGEELAEDYYPGTILIGARTDPSDPWVVSRNSRAKLLSGNPEDVISSDVVFEYDFALLPEIKAMGRFYEVAGPLPQIVWDLELRNKGRVSIEIGELGFPLALNNFYDGFGWSDEQLRRLWQSRLYIHKYIGGAASWVFAQRMTAEPPGLLIFPGEGTGWEFYCHVPASLNTPHQWEGIPVVYVYSKATVEREQWQPWSNDHTSLVLEPGDGRRVQMRFVPCDSDKHDGVGQTLAAIGHPTMRILPCAVAPIDVGIAVEVTGSPTERFFVNRESRIEVDIDEEGGFCFVHPNEPGPIRLSVEHKNGLLSHMHLIFTEPIEELIKKRAAYIAGAQVHSDPDSPLDKAILLTNIATGARAIEPEEYQGASGIECSLADALFLAEKNAHYPNKGEIQILEDYVEGFLLDDIQNPGDLSVGSVIAEGGLGAYAGRPLTYPHVFNLYHSMFRIAANSGEARQEPLKYLSLAAKTAIALFRFGWRSYVRTVGLLGYSGIYSLLDDLKQNELYEEYWGLLDLVEERAKELAELEYPYAGESVLDTSGFEDVFSAALYLENHGHLDRTLRCAFATRSLAPSWWWYGSDKRAWDGADSTPLRALVDRGEACQAHTCMPNSLLFFKTMDRDYLAIPEAYVRLAFGGMMGPWALVRNDGAASMCYCPDPASRQHGYNAFTGASGLGYYHYLRGASAFVFPNRAIGVYTYGCHFEADHGVYRVKPWDGVGRRIVLRQIGFSCELGFGKILEFTLDQRKRWFEILIENPSAHATSTTLLVRGLWGTQVEVEGKVLPSLEGTVPISVKLSAGEVTKLRGTVRHE